MITWSVNVSQQLDDYTPLICLCYRSPHGHTNRQSITPDSNRYVLLKLLGIRLLLSASSTSLCLHQSSGLSFPDMMPLYCWQSNHPLLTIFYLVCSTSLFRWTLECYSADHSLLSCFLARSTNSHTHCGCILPHRANLASQQFLHLASLQQDSFETGPYLQMPTPRKSTQTSHITSVPQSSLSLSLMHLVITSDQSCYRMQNTFSGEHKRALHYQKCSI